MEDFTITVDDHFLAQAVTVAMQMRSELDEEEFIVVQDKQISDNGNLILLVAKKKATIN